ncbi:MAG: Gmad2 immunoglobulin-like domain-containing protein [Minisyncoccia bacterium]
MKKIWWLIVVLIILGVGAIWYQNNLNKIPAETQPQNTVSISDKSDLIRVTTPQPNDIITNPLIIKGVARGTWFFEASFPVELRIPSKPPQTVIARAPAHAEGDWMTNDFVPFEATLTFENPTGLDTMVPPNPNRCLILELKKDNPSGLPEHDDSLDIPVCLGK